jgi:hypothetical protein
VEKKVRSPCRTLAWSSTIMTAMCFMPGRLLSRIRAAIGQRDRLD